MHALVHLGEVERGGLQAQIHRKGRTLQGEEAGEGKLYSMWIDSGVVVPEGKRVEATCQEYIPDEGGEDGEGGGGTN